MRLEEPETKTCESCGAQFSCGAKSEKCWCFQSELTREALAKLRVNFADCLCPDCLNEYHENAGSSD